MLRSLLALSLLCVAATPANNNTGWLDSSHPQIKLLIEHTQRENCSTDCDRYILVLSYRADASAEARQHSEGKAFAAANCVDVVTAGGKWFTCRLPGALAGTSKAGQTFATMRFRIKAAQLESLAAGDATLRIQSIRVTLPEPTRAAIAAFLRQPEVVALSRNDRHLNE